MELVVVSTLLSSFNSICSGFRMYWAELLQVGLALVSILCCPDFRRSARAGLLALERRLHTPSFSCPCKTSAGVIFMLEWVSLRSSGGARAGTLALERVVLFWCKFREGKIYARADRFSRSSGCALFLCLGARAGLLALERVQIFVLDARALCSPLERECRISVGSWAF